MRIDDGKDCLAAFCCRGTDDGIGRARVAHEALGSAQHIPAAAGVEGRAGACGFVAPRRLQIGDGQGLLSLGDQRQPFILHLLRRAIGEQQAGLDDA